MTNLSSINKSIIPENISNVNKAYTKNSAHNESMFACKSQKPKFSKTSKVRKTHRSSANKSLQRYKLGCNLPASQEHSESLSKYSNKPIPKYTLNLQESRNQDFKKTKSIGLEKPSNLKFDVKVQSLNHSKRCLTKRLGKPRIQYSQLNSTVNRSTDKSAFTMNQLFFDEMMNKKRTLSKMSSQKLNIKLTNGRTDDNYYSSKVQQIVSSNNSLVGKNVVAYAPHGGVFEKGNNEERLNFLSDSNSKLESLPLNVKLEK